MSEPASPQPAGDPAAAGQEGPWWRGLSRYMWWVLVVAALGWVFDVMDQRIFVLSRDPALNELLSVRLEEERVLRSTAGEVADWLGVEPGIDPSTAVSFAEAEMPRHPRPRLLLPPLERGQPDRELPFVRQREGEIRVLPPREKNVLIGRIATAIFMVGWATGGLFFGILGDKLGRVFTMMLTILIYSVFTGLSALSVTWIDYSAYRFLTGLGVGGEFAAGAALVAEVMPARARPYALGLLQALSALGNIGGSLIASAVLPASDPAGAWENWRLLYLIGILPALLLIVIRMRLREPEEWKAVKSSTGKLVGEQLGAFGDLFRPPWRRNTLFGVTFAVSGVIGLWGIGFWTPELIRTIVPDPQVRSYATALQDVGAFLGIAAITIVTQGAPRWRWKLYLPGLLVALVAAALAHGLGGGTPEAPAATAFLGVSLAGSLYFILALTGVVSGGLGRRLSFALSFAMALAATIVVFGSMKSPGQIYWMIPVFGFSTLLCFGMYAIYFPELYPTRLRTTGTGFCYNVARYIAAGGIFLLGYLGTIPGFDFRTSTQVFALIYVVGLLAAYWAPETRNRSLGGR
jgi:MFS family permease